MMINKQKILYVMVLVVSMVALVSPQFISACEEGRFEKLNGPTAVKFGERYTYSVYPRGTFESVNWSAAGGEVLKTWDDGKTYFADVRWTHKHPEKGTRLKVWGKDGCGTMRDARLPVSTDAKEDSGTGRGISVAAQFYDLSDERGDHIVVTQNSAKLSSDWDNRISSVWVFANREVTLYEGSGYSGKSMTLEGGSEGRRYNLPKRFDNNVSSFKVK